MLGESASRYSRAFCGRLLGPSLLNSGLRVAVTTCWDWFRPQMVLADLVLQALLGQTQSSGPGENDRWLPIFISAEASFYGLPWLQAGFDIWQREGSASSAIF